MTILSIFQSDWFSWLLQLNCFFLLCAYSGIKWRWAVLALLLLEVFEMTHQTGYTAAAWFTQPDTVMDIAFGLLGIWQGVVVRDQKRTAKEKEN